MGDVRFHFVFFKVKGHSVRKRLSPPPLIQKDVFLKFGIMIYRLLDVYVYVDAYGQIYGHMGEFASKTRWLPERSYQPRRKYSEMLDLSGSGLQTKASHTR